MFIPGYEAFCVCFIRGIWRTKNFLWQAKCFILWYSQYKVFFTVVEKNISITKSAKFSTEKIHIHILVETIIYMSTTLISTWASCLTSYFVFCRFKSPTKNIPYSATFRNYFHFLPHRCWWRYRVQNIPKLSSTAYKITLSPTRLNQ